jgi:hypothetical protein
MDAAGYIYIYYVVILLWGLIFVTLLLSLISQHGSKKRQNRKTLAMAMILGALFVAVFWEPVVTTLIVIPSMCKEHGGLHLHEKAEANGFFANVFDKRYLMDYGFSFVEYVDYSNYSKKRYVTKRVGQNKDIEIDDAWREDRPQSRYHYATCQRLEINKTGMLNYLNVRGERDYILDEHENRVMGEIIRYHYGGSDFRYAMHRMLPGKKRTCWPPERDPKNRPLPSHVLQPSG